MDKEIRRERCISCVEDAQNRAAQWLLIYNNERPNMGLNGITPMMKSAAA